MRIRVKFYLFILFYKKKLLLFMLKLKHTLSIKFVTSKTFANLNVDIFDEHKYVVLRAHNI